MMYTKKEKVSIKFPPFFFHHSSLLFHNIEKAKDFPHFSLLFHNIEKAKGKNCPMSLFPNVEQYVINIKQSHKEKLAKKSIYTKF